jgi:hypothetical protein
VRARLVQAERGNHKIALHFFLIVLRSQPSASVLGDCGEWQIASEDTSAYARLMARMGLRLVFAIVVPSAICQVPQPKSMSVPALPFYDWKACPFEGCSYSQWKARKQIVVYDTWKQDRKAIAQLSKGDSVLGVTGVVITFRPGVIRLDRDLPEHNLKRGDTILTYTYRGEGYSAVWFKGRYHSEFDISFARRPDGQGCGGADCAATYVDLGRKVWWAEVKLKSGHTGWVNMDDADFEGVDSLAMVNGHSHAF